MKYITSASEKLINEMVKNEMLFGSELNYILNEMKCRESYLGSSIKEMKENWIMLKNETQIDLVITDLLHGIAINYEKYISVVDRADLHYANIKDFNKLVKQCYNDSIINK